MKPDEQRLSDAAAKLSEATTLCVMINQVTARAIGLKIPQPLLLQADEVIE